MDVPPLRPAPAHCPPSGSRRSDSLRSWSGEAPKADSVRTLSLSLESADDLATFRVKQEQRRQEWGTHENGEAGNRAAPGPSARWPNRTPICSA